MRLTFVQLRTYVSDAAALRLTDSDQQAIEEILLVRPAAGAVIPGTGGLRKLRFSPSSRRGGKSGGIRVCYAWFPEVAHV